MDLNRASSQINEFDLKTPIDVDQALVNYGCMEIFLVMLEEFETLTMNSTMKNVV